MPDVFCNKCGDSAQYSMDCKCPNDVTSETGYSHFRTSKWICPTCAGHIVDRVVRFTISPLDFEGVLGYYPKTQDEFEQFFQLVEKSLTKSDHIDWDVIYQCVKDEWR